MMRFRKWLITKLGGVIEDRWQGFPPDYWVDTCIQKSIYVPDESYTDSSKKNIELELARLIGEEMLKRGYLSFSRNRRLNHGDVYVYANANVLYLKERTPSHMKSHL